MSHICINRYNTFLNKKTRNKRTRTFIEPTVAVSGTSMYSSGTLKDFMLKVTEGKYNKCQDFAQNNKFKLKVQHTSHGRILVP